MKKLAAVLFVFISFGFLSMAASADSLTLTGTGGQAVGGVYVYPYNFTLTDASHPTGTSISLMCMDYTRDITFGENWNITETNLPLTVGNQGPPDETNPVDAAEQQNYDAEAILLNGLLNNLSSPQLVADYQFAAWEVFDEPDPSTSNLGWQGTGNPGFTSNATSLANAALANAINPNFVFNYSDFTIYTPVIAGEGNNGGGFDPQEFIGENSAPFQPHLTPTPEPSSLMLLGTGVLGAAGMLRKRFIKA